MGSQTRLLGVHEKPIEGEGFPIVGKAWEWCPPILRFFQTPPIKTNAPHGAHLPLKSEAPPHLKSNTHPPPPPLKREAPLCMYLLSHNQKADLVYAVKGFILGVCIIFRLKIFYWMTT